MKAFTIVLGLFAALAVSDIVSAADDVPRCGNEKAVRCIGLKGDMYEDTVSTVKALKKVSSERVCQCETDKNHLYIVANNNFVETMEKCKRFAYRGL
ncbi:hypothetical protein BGX28_000914, partial [Mortierella sp. GBA30]